MLIGLSAALGACSMAPEAIVTGGVPDDYRLRHPIAITEANRSVVVFVGHGRGGLTAPQRDDVAGLARTWVREGTGAVAVDVPVDTPNARVTRLQQTAFIDPDHKVEYTQELLTTKLQDAGFTILESKGINYAGHSRGGGAFSLADVAGNVGTFAEGRDCYILTFLCSS